MRQQPVLAMSSLSTRLAAEVAKRRDQKSQDALTAALRILTVFAKSVTRLTVYAESITLNTLDIAHDGEAFTFDADQVRIEEASSVPTVGRRWHPLADEVISMIAKTIGPEFHVQWEMPHPDHKGASAPIRLNLATGSGDGVVLPPMITFGDPPDAKGTSGAAQIAAAERAADTMIQPTTAVSGMADATPDAAPDAGVAGAAPDAEVADAAPDTEAVSGIIPGATAVYWARP